MGIRITTWNVNGIRNPFGYAPWNQKRTFASMFEILETDILIMQETKIQRKDLKDDMVLVPGWDVFFSLPKHKKGYSGVAIYTRNSACCPIRAEEGLLGVLTPPGTSTKFRELPADQQIGGYPTEEQIAGPIDEATLDSEGRCVLLEFPAFVLIGTYCPASRDETRTDFRIAFFNALDARIRNLVAMGKEVVLAGDLNIIRSERDTAGLPEQLRKEAMTYDEFLSMPSRRFFNHLIHDGDVVGERDAGREVPVMWDLCRIFNPVRQGMYTCWETKKNARPGNFGSRIDYVLCTSGIESWFENSNIQEGLLGSDHCPVFAELKDKVDSPTPWTASIDLMNPKGMFEAGKRLRQWSAKDLLPLSAKLIPEFDRRQSIKDMFFKKPIVAQPASTAPALAPAVTIERRPSANSGVSSQTAHPNTQGFTPSAAKESEIPSSILLSPPKRTAASPLQSDAKRPRAALSREKSRSVTGLAQSSLKGFFKTKPDDANATTWTDTPPPSTSRSSVDIPASPGLTRTDSIERTEAPPDTSTAGGGEPITHTAGDDSPTKDGKVFDPIVSKESWSKLLAGKRAAPKCEHQEPCMSMLTKKPGVNCGRSFYMCSRPLGPTGQKERGTQWRCGTFIWSSEWKDTS